MNVRNILIIPILFIVALSCFFSCGVDRWPEYYDQTARDLWMDSVMRENYLWYKDLPSTNKINYFLSPEAYLKSVVPSKDKGFSTVDTIDNRPVLSYGYDYTLYRMEKNDTAYCALITYVVPNSPASRAGIERGAWIMKVDDEFITRKNEDVILNEGGAKVLSMGKIVVTKDEQTKRDKEHVVANGTLEIGAPEVVVDPPIHCVRTYNYDGKKVGYLFYSHFTAGTEENAQIYNDNLKQLSNDFLSEKVDEFILDLRYNTGGEMECVQLLSGILAPASYLDSPFAYLQYNDKNTNKDKELTLSKELLGTGTNLNLPSLYVIVSGVTAGAPEMLINCLQPYFDKQLVILGSTTKGENVATEPYINPKFPWVFRPVVCEIFNSKKESNYSSGIKPTYAVNETDSFRNFLPFGDINEDLLHIALKCIDGSYPPKKDENTVTPLQVTPVRSTFINRKARRGLRIN